MSAAQVTLNFSEVIDAIITETLVRAIEGRILKSTRPHTHIERSVGAMSFPRALKQYFRLAPV